MASLYPPRDIKPKQLGVFAEKIAFFFYKYNLKNRRSCATIYRKLWPSLRVVQTAEAVWVFDHVRFVESVKYLRTAGLSVAWHQTSQQHGVKNQYGRPSYIVAGPFLSCGQLPRRSICCCSWVPTEGLLTQQEHKRHCNDGDSWGIRNSSRTHSQRFLGFR